MVGRNIGLIKQAYFWGLLGLHTREKLTNRHQFTYPQLHGLHTRAKSRSTILGWVSIDAVDI